MKQGSYIYDLILFALMALLAFGLIGNGAQPVRLFIIALSPFVVADVFNRPHKSLYYYRYECFFLAFWFLWALAFFFKADDEIESFKNVIYLAIHILGFFEVLWAANKAKYPQQAIKYGWLAFMVSTIPVAIYEFLTDFHLGMSFQDSGNTMYVNGVHIERPFASVTFGNLNSYNTVLCWALPSLFMCNLYPRGKWEQLLGMVVMGFTSLIIIANASRGAMLCLVIMLGTYVYAYYKFGRNRYLLITVLVLAIGALVYFLGELFILIVEKVSMVGLGDDGRAENLVMGFQAFLDSYGLGIGIGNYGPIMEAVYHVEVPAPHNLFLEVLVCFGLFVALGFLGMVFRIVRIGLRQGEPFNRNMLMFCMAAMLFAGIIDSNYLMKATTWMFLASVYVYVDSRYNRVIPK